MFTTEYELLGRVTPADQWEYIRSFESAKDAEEFLCKYVARITPMNKYGITSKFRDFRIQKYRRITSQGENR